MAGSFFYTKETITTAKNYNLDERTVLFCQLVAAGADRGEAYHAIYDHGSKGMKATLETERTKANELIKLNPGAAVLITRLKERRQINSVQAKNQVKDAEQAEQVEGMSEEERKKFTDKNFIIASLAAEARNLTGKDKTAVLMQIADLQRMKNEENKQEEEQRRYYLPFISHCKTCKIVEIYKKIIQSKPET